MTNTKTKAAARCALLLKRVHTARKNELRASCAIGAAYRHHYAQVIRLQAAIKQYQAAKEDETQTQTAPGAAH